MPTLADIYSAADSFKRRLSDAASNPSGALSQMLGYANDRARDFNQLQQQATGEIRQGGFANQGPATQALDQAYAESLQPIGMTVIPFGKTRNVTVPIGQDVAAVNPVEVRARKAIDDLVNQAKYFGVDSPIDHTKMPVGGVMAHLDDYLGRSQQVAELPDAAKASLRNLWYKAEDAANAYKRVYGENKLMGKMEEAANKESYSANPPWFSQELEDKYLNKEITKRKYESQVLKNMQDYFKKK